MGLKTTNYRVKATDYVYTNAYALLKDISIQGDWVNAVFAIQTSREKAVDFEPIETVSITFKFDRTKNPVEMAYNLVKSKIKDYVWNDELQAHVEVEKEMPLFGWEDDIV